MIISKPYLLFITYVPFCGFGASFLSVSAVACIGDYFPKNSPNYFFASVIVLAAMPLGNDFFSFIF